MAVYSLDATSNEVADLRLTRIGPSQANGTKTFSVHRTWSFIFVPGVAGAAIFTFRVVYRDQL